MITVNTKLILFAIFSLFVITIAVPTSAYASVESVSLTRAFFTEEDQISFEGKESTGRQSVFVIIRDADGGYKGMVSDPSSDPDGTFTTIPRDVDGFFKSKEIYSATAFTDEQKEKDGVTIKLEYDGDKVFLVPDFVLSLKSISDKTIEEGKTLSFTAVLTESVDDAEFSLGNGAPSGATIDASTGKFVWTPSSSQASGSYTIDIIVKKGGLEDTESIKITVTKKPVTQPTQQPTTQPEPPTTEPEPPQQPTELGIAAFVDETKDPQTYVDRYNNEPTYKEWFDDNYSEYTSIYQAVGLEEPVEIAAFVDPNQDPQYYVDRYNNEPTYKEWFDDNYSEYTSIYQAVGLEEPVEIAAFVDPNQDPQTYVDRYNNEPTYKEWFDDNYSEYTSIYQAVGLEEPVEIAAFVDPNQDPQTYVDRYNNEPTYKEWFDDNYSEYTSIYQAVGLEEPSDEEVVDKIGECGEGTSLVDGICTPDNTSGGGCLIATATYGSEMAPQVQFLREIRDNTVLSTESGMTFMTGFNQVYYSFSPYIADYERENPAFKELVKIGITPLLTSLNVMSLADSEQEILGYGIAVILMNLGMYVAAPAILVYKGRKLIKI